MRTALIAGIIQNHSQRDAEVERGELPQEGTDFRGSNVGVVGDGDEFMGDGVERAQDIEALPPGWGAEEDAGSQTRGTPGRELTQSARHRQRRRRAAPHGPGLSAAPTPLPGNALARRGRLWRGACRRADNGDGVFFKILAHLRLTALDARQGFDLALGFFDRCRRMGAKIRFQRGIVFLQRTLRSLNRDFFQSFDATFEIELEVVP